MAHGISDKEFIEVLRKHAENPDCAFRRFAAKELATMIENGSNLSMEARTLLETLAHDEAAPVRVVVARRAAHLSNEAIIALANDDDLGVRYEIAEYARKYFHIDVEYYCGTYDEVDTICNELVKKLSK